MKNKGIVAVLGLCMLFVSAKAQKHAENTNYPSYKGLTMSGYQGWFRMPKEGLMYPDETKVRLDMWPDISEYELTYPTGLKMADGSTARFFLLFRRSKYH